MQEFDRPLPPTSLIVVGADYRNADGSDRREAIAACHPGEPVELRPEPHNKHDKQAVAVWSKRGQQLGFLSAERCGRIGALIRKGHEVRAVFQRPDRAGAWIRVAFDGEEPVVPVREDEDKD